MVAVAGDTQVAIPGGALRLRGIGRSVTIAAAAVLIRLAIDIRCRPRHDRRREATAAVFRLTVLTILAADLGLLLGHLVVACGGLDSAGYLASARLFLSGHLTEYQPVARWLPFAGATAAASPLGMVPAATPYFMAPRFPPGLPLVMAASLALGGRTAPFFVTPVLGAGVVAITYVTARRMTEPVTAALAAVMAGTTPAFLDMALQPMSDVPATFWVILTAFYLWRPAPRPALAALSAGMAILTRPPLALAAVALALTTAWPDRRRPAIFALLTGVFVAALMALQSHIYGHAFTSGYGSAGQLFMLSALGAQILLHGKWLLTVHTPLLVLLFAAGAAARRALAARAGVVFLAVAAPYLIYAPRFEDWEIVRFLLPGLPFVFIVCASGVVWLVRGYRHPLRAMIAATGVSIAIAGGAYAFAAAHHLFDLRNQEMKYPLVGEWFAKHTPPNAVAIAALHSGSVHFYSGRPVVRADAIPDGLLLDTVRSLERAAYVPYLVLESGDEYEVFERRQPDAARSLTMVPEARIRGVLIARLSSAR
jgi:hypothetical protein